MQESKQVCNIGARINTNTIFFLGGFLFVVIVRKIPTTVRKVQSELFPIVPFATRLAFKRNFAAPLAADF